MHFPVWKYAVRQDLFFLSSLIGGNHSAPMSNAEKCPVDHGSAPPATAAGQTCPVDHSSPSSSTWSRFLPSLSSSPGKATPLSVERETSSIPKAADGNWVYPSEAQFFAAMARKNHNPQAADMKTIVPIHNAVNERAWAEVMKWEAGRGGSRDRLCCMKVVLALSLRAHHVISKREH